MSTTFYDHWCDVPESDWCWPNFSPAEIACRGTGKLLVNEPALDKLQALRDRLGDLCREYAGTKPAFTFGLENLIEMIEMVRRCQP